jgi:hypothetical protein
MPYTTSIIIHHLLLLSLTIDTTINTNTNTITITAHQNRYQHCHRNHRQNHRQNHDRQQHLVFNPSKNTKTILPPKPLRLSTSIMHFIQSSALLSMALALCSVAAPVDESMTNKLSKRLEDGQYNANSGGTYNGEEGTYIKSDSVHHYASGVKYCTDYMVVSQEIGHDALERASGNFYCATASQCSSESTTGIETCEVVSGGVSAGIGNEIFNFGVSAGYELSTCKTASEAQTCGWEDDLCHYVTTAQQVLISKGYQRRRCDDNGDYTAWLKDFEHRAPMQFADVHCENLC